MLFSKRLGPAQVASGDCVNENLGVTDSWVDDRNGSDGGGPENAKANGSRSLGTLRRVLNLRTAGSDVAAVALEVQILTKYNLLISPMTDAIVRGYQ